MNVAVLLAGIIDPNWSLGSLRAAAGGLVAGDESLARKLSPFDEAALETALKLRDADPDVKITAFLLGGPQGEQLLRSAAAHRLQHLFLVDCEPGHRWDVARLARTLNTALHTMEAKPDLVLIGREFGDCDDGALPPYLAEVRGSHFIGLAQEIAREGGNLKFRRARGDVDEWLALPPPAVASVTNDKANRLRHPLMKNVMAAKRDTFPVLLPPGADALPQLTLSTLKASEPARHAGAVCRMLAGPVDSQVAELAEFLRLRRGAS